jgi:hypothetical protein
MRGSSARATREFSSRSKPDNPATGSHVQGHRFLSRRVKLADETGVDHGTEPQFNEGTARTVICVPETKGADQMAKAKEFTVTIEDKPGALGKCLLALAQRGVNILAFQSYVEEGESLARFVADDMASAKAVLGSLHMIFEETDVAVVRLAHRPGQLGRAAARLGEKQVNIDYTYCGLEPDSSLGLVVFGVDNLTKAAAALDELATESA